MNDTRYFQPSAFDERTAMPAEPGRNSPVHGGYRGWVYRYEPNCDDVSVTLGRNLWSPGGGDAWASFAVFGEFAEVPTETQLPDSRANVLSRDQVIELTANLRPQHKDALAYDRAGEAPAAVWLVVRQEDPRTLDYLARVVSAVESLFRQGAVAVLDMNAIVLQSAEEWRERMAGDSLKPLQFTATYWWSEEDHRGEWWRTRGMLSFGRPDISLRRVPSSARGAAHGLIQQLIVNQADGAVLTDEEIMHSGDISLRFEIADAFEDPMFLNRRAEATWPSQTH